MRRILVLAIVCTVHLLLVHEVLRAQDRQVKAEAIINAPVDRVWSAWTTTKGVVSFFAPAANIDARPDGAFEIYFDPAAPQGAKGADGMRFLAVDPQRMISFTWNAPAQFPAVRRQRTVVTVRFEALKTATRVQLFQTGWGTGAEWDQAFEYFKHAWPNVLALLRYSFDHGAVDWNHRPDVKPQEPPFEVDSYFMVFLNKGPKWTATESPELEKLMQGHLANIRALWDEGSAVLAGPFGDNESPRGVIILKVPSPEEARNLVERDPAVKAGHLTVQVRPWFTQKGVLRGKE